MVLGFSLVVFEREITQYVYFRLLFAEYPDEHERKKAEKEDEGEDGINADPGDSF